ncbi:MAG: hypothetical protein HKL90_12520 [Elusimicrobia bacterium]|nr:hypothetical protein [Elusimicrobiota bacterium]
MNEFKRFLRKAGLLSAAAVAVFMGGCSDPGKDAKHYAMTGKIVEVDKPDQALEVDMDAVPGYMEAMVMSVHVKDAAELESLRRGDAIRADLVVHSGGSWIQHVQVVAKAK